MLPSIQIIWSGLREKNVSEIQKSAGQLNVKQREAREKLLKGSDLQARIDSEEAVASARTKRSDFHVSEGSAAFEDAQTILNDKRNSANDALKKAKKDAVARELAKAATGAHSDAYDELASFFQAHQSEIRTYARADLGNGQTLGDFLTDTYGKRILEGKIDLSTVLSQTKAGSDIAVYEIDVEGMPGYEKVVIDMSKTGDERFVLQGPGGATMKFETEEALKAELDAKKAKIKDARTINGMAEAVTSKQKDDFDNARTALVNSDEFISEHRRQQKQREKERKG